MPTQGRVELPFLTANKNTRVARSRHKNHSAVKENAYHQWKFGANLSRKPLGDHVVFCTKSFQEGGVCFRYWFRFMAILKAAVGPYSCVVKYTLVSSFDVTLRLTLYTATGGPSDRLSAMNFSFAVNWILMKVVGIMCINFNIPVFGLKGSCSISLSACSSRPICQTTLIRFSWNLWG